MRIIMKYDISYHVARVLFVPLWEFGRFSLKVDNVIWSFLSPLLPQKTEINNKNYQTTIIFNKSLQLTIIFY